MSLGAESLFLRKPETLTNPTSISDLLSKLQQGASYVQLIDTTYNLLKSQITFEQQLVVWEIRLTLHLFNKQLSLAKKEAINLNNALYLKENPNVSKPTPHTKNESITIYPLPRNNDGAIEHNFLVLILRLAAIPNIHLVGELYKLSYPMRLKSESQTSKLELMKRLINLSYDVIVVLTINKNFPTVINYLESLKYELVIQGIDKPKPEILGSTSKSSQLYSDYHSNLTLILVIVSLLSTNQALIDNMKHKVKFSQINATSLNALLYVINSFTPQLNSGDAIKSDVQSIDSIDDIEKLVLGGRITARIICCTLGVWNLHNNYGLQITDEGKVTMNEVQELSKSQSSQITSSEEESNTKTEIGIELNQCKAILNRGWMHNINRVYCLE